MRSVEFPQVGILSGLEATEAGLGEGKPLTDDEKALLAGLFDLYEQNSGRGDLVAAAPYFQGLRKPDMLTAYKQTYDDGRLADLRVQLKALVGNRCPSCGGSRPGQLDHHLPKTHYPEYAVLPINLIACCGECNGKKSHIVGATAEQAYLHPYFDRVPAVVFMDAALDLQARHIDVVLTFKADTPIGDAELKARMKHQFDKIDLNARVKSDVAEYVTERSGTLEDQYGDDPDPAMVRATVLLWAVRADTNHTVGSWQSAVLRALAANAEYCAGGYRATGKTALPAA